MYQEMALSQLYQRADISAILKIWYIRYDFDTSHSKSNAKVRVLWHDRMTAGGFALIHHTLNSITTLPEGWYSFIAVALQSSCCCKQDPHVTEETEIYVASTLWVRKTITDHRASPSISFPSPYRSQSDQTMQVLHPCLPVYPTENSSSPPPCPAVEALLTFPQYM